MDRPSGARWRDAGGAGSRVGARMTLGLLTAGESHGERLTVILAGVPAGLTVREEDLPPGLTRRQGGHGRGGRMAIEHDTAHIVAGVRGGLTLGSPIPLEIPHPDWGNGGRGW